MNQAKAERLDPRPAWFRRRVEIRLFEEAFVLPPAVAVDVSVITRMLLVG